MFAKNRQMGSRREISRFHPVTDREKAERGEVHLCEGFRTWRDV
jgi:hypothetical protein